jgi:hypothetical protein
MVPGVFVLQGKGCLLLRSDSGNSGLQLSQRSDIAVRVHGVLRFARMTRSRQSSFLELTAVQHHSERGCLTSLSPLLKSTTYCLLCSHPPFGPLEGSTGAASSPLEKFIDTTLLHNHFHVKRQYARLLLCCYLLHVIKFTNCWREGLTSIATPPASASNVVSQRSEIGGITFRAHSYVTVCL